MSDKLLISLISLLICTPVLGQKASVPKFEDYPTKNKFTGMPAIPLIPKSWNDLPNWADAVRFAQARGPNFAGKYTIAQWSCGTGCSSMAIIDTGSGRILPDNAFGTLDLEKGSGEMYSGLNFRLDSTLIIVEGCLDLDNPSSDPTHPDCSKTYWRWDGARFQQLYKISYPPPEKVQKYLNEFQ